MIMRAKVQRLSIDELLQLRTRYFEVADKSLS